MEERNQQVDKAFHDLRATMAGILAFDIETFAELMGIDKMRAVICFERAKGSSWKQISIKLGDLPIRTIRRRCARCASTDKVETLIKQKK